MTLRQEIQHSLEILKLGEPIYIQFADEAERKRLVGLCYYAARRAGFKVTILKLGGPHEGVALER